MTERYTFTRDIYGNLDTSDEPKFNATADHLQATRRPPAFE
jgi:hypothetical protein